MRGWDSVTRVGSLRLGPTALAILFGGLLLSLAPISRSLENGFFDTLQRLGNGTARSDIVLVDTRSLRSRAGSTWESERFPELLEALGRAGARLVLPTEAPPLTAGLPDARQLAALADLEQRNRRSDQAQERDVLAEKWADMRQRSELHARTVEAVRQLRNLILGVPAFDTASGAVPTGPTCQKHLLAMQADGQDEVSGARRVRAVAPSPRELCDVALGAGHIGFWSDSDGVVRRLDLLINAAGDLVQAVALRAVLAVTFPSGKPVTVGADGITWDSQRIRTSGGPATLLRFYPADPRSGGFESVTAEEILRSPAAAQRVAGKIVVVGDGAVGNGQGYDTPIGANVAPAILMATGLSNLLSGDYLVRPNWLPWAETVLLLLIGAAAIIGGRRLPPTLAAMTALCAATFLLAMEAYFVSVGIWAELATAAVFAVFCLGVTSLLPARTVRDASAPVANVAVPAEPATGPGAAVGAGDELDLAFSMLRHQPATDNVKQRLYDVALAHARGRDLAKAERVLRHLASIDPDYRNAGEKLKKLAGMHVPVAAAAAAATARAPEPAPAADAAKPTRASDHGEDLSGRTIGRYEIERIIGRGAMASVYLGRDPKINRRVAIKTIALAEEFSDSDLVNARTQFLREAESAGRLNHPHIISIYDAGEEGRIAYLAMEYCVGKPLSYYAQQGQLLPPKWVLEIMARAADALHYAHQQHVVHRDVKPANLLYDAETDTLKITDFGIARLTDTSRTKTGIILGTPSYMSPEQLAGTGVTGQSDLFSLGITLYQLLTGIPPFRADSIPRLMQKIAHEPHQPVTQVRDDLPAAIDSIIERALAKDPVNRFPNGRAMALALRDCCSSF